MGCCAPPPLTLRPQMCNLLQYFCDRELQHRVEAIVAFSERHVERLQRDQRRRYGQLMRALTMSAAETARRTREFRSPPQEQVTPPARGRAREMGTGMGTPMGTWMGSGDRDGAVHEDAPKAMVGVGDVPQGTSGPPDRPPRAPPQINMLLQYKAGADEEECPVPEDIRDELLDFHNDLLAHCGQPPIPHPSDPSLCLPPRPPDPSPCPPRHRAGGRGGGGGGGDVAAPPAAGAGAEGGGDAQEGARGGGAPRGAPGAQ